MMGIIGSIEVSEKLLHRGDIQFGINDNLMEGKRTLLFQLEMG